MFFNISPIACFFRVAFISTRRLCLTVVTLMLVMHHVPARGEAIFSIGNSLTWDTDLFYLDGSVDYHIACNWNLEQISSDPSFACVDGNSRWDIALSSKQYDVLTVQPYRGTTMSEDVAAINHWMSLQPDARVVIHTGWARIDEIQGQYHNTDSTALSYSPAYFDELVNRLREADPDRSIRRTRAMDAIYLINQDTGNGLGPFSDMSELYRDPVHMNYSAGRLLAHNAMREALGQPLRDTGWGVSGENAAYLNSKITAVPEPSFSALLTICTCFIGLQRWRSRCAGLNAAQEPRNWF